MHKVARNTYEHNVMIWVLKTQYNRGNGIKKINIHFPMILLLIRRCALTRLSQETKLAQNYRAVTSIREHRLPIQNSLKSLVILYLWHTFTSLMELSQSWILTTFFMLTYQLFMGSSAAPHHIHPDLHLCSTVSSPIWIFLSSSYCEYSVYVKAWRFQHGVFPCGVAILVLSQYHLPYLIETETNGSTQFVHNFMLISQVVK